MEMLLEAHHRRQRGWLLSSCSAALDGQDEGFKEHNQLLNQHKQGWVSVAALLSLCDKQQSLLSSACSAAAWRRER